MLKVDSSSCSRAATVRSSREKDSDGFMALTPPWAARVPPPSRAVLLAQLAAYVLTGLGFSLAAGGPVSGWIAALMTPLRGFSSILL